MMLPPSIWFFRENIYGWTFSNLIDQSSHHADRQDLGGGPEQPTRRRVVRPYRAACDC